jgi:uncharacterized protein with HEPN domain
MVHAYLDLDNEIVWQVIEQDLPALKAAVEDVLSTLEENGTAS